MIRPTRPTVLPPLARRLLTGLAVLAGALTLAGPAVAATPAAPSGDQDVTWTVRTASNDLGADRTSFTYTLDPGRSVTDGLVVANRGRTAVELSVYAADGYTTQTGQLDLVVAGATSVGVGAWAKPRVEHVTVAPGKTADVPFTLTVPQTATPGDYVGGVVTSLRQEGEGGDGDAITVDRRLGVRLTLHVGGTVSPALAVEGVHVDHSTTADPLGRGGTTVRYTLHNTGNTVLSARQGVALAGPFGVLRSTVTPSGDVPDLLPGESWKVTVPVPDVVASGHLTATVTATPLLTDASGSTSALDPVEAHGSTWALPWVLVGLLVVVVVLVVLAVRTLRRRGALRREREEARVEEAVAAALRERDAVDTDQEAVVEPASAP